jgi:methionine-rich copper-binding protein CopC
MKLVPAALAAILIAAAATVAAGAHAELVSASPGPGEQVPEPVSELVLTFDEPVQVPSQVQLITQDFQPVSGVSSTVNGPKLVGHVDPGLPAGDYSVLWTAVSGDGHTTAGSYQFGVRPAVSSTPVWLLAAAGALVVVGAWAIWRRRAASEEPG